MQQKIHIRSLEDTARLAGALIQVVRCGDILSLEGDLGAGKTALTRELSKHLGVSDHVTSPTFVLQKMHRTVSSTIPLVIHYDVYRIMNYRELIDIGFEDLLPDGLTVVEWGDRFAADYPVQPIRVALEITGETSRMVTLDLPRDITIPFSLVQESKPDVQ